MPTCRTEIRLQRRPRGFTLLELMVVMVLLGLVTSMTLPAMQRWHDGLLARTEASAIVEKLQAAAFDAGVQKRSLRLDAESFTQGTPPREGVAGHDGSKKVERVKLSLPPGWQLGRSVAAVFGADGLCKPGLIALRSSRGTPLIFTVQGPICKIEWTRDHSASEP